MATTLAPRPDVTAEPAVLEPRTDAPPDVDPVLQVLLARHRVSPGDRVLVVMKDREVRAELARACWAMGAVVVVVDPDLPEDVQLAAFHTAHADLILGDALGLRRARPVAGPRARLWVSRTALRARRLARSFRAPDAAPAPRPSTVPGPDEDAAIVFSRGTDDETIGVFYSHHDLDEAVSMVRVTMQWQLDTATAFEWNARLRRLRRGTTILAAELRSPGSTQLPAQPRPQLERAAGLG